MIRRRTTVTRWDARLPLWGIVGTLLLGYGVGILLDALTPLDFAAAFYRQVAWPWSLWPLPLVAAWILSGAVAIGVSCTPWGSERLAGGMIPGDHADSGCFGIYTVEVPWYDTPGVRRALRGWGGYGQFSGIPNGVGTYLGTRGCGTFFGTWGAEEAVTQLTVQSSTGIFAAGSRGVLYGVL